MSGSQPGAKPRSRVRVPNYVSADDILERAAKTRTLKVKDEDVAAFTELLNEFRESDYLYTRRLLQKDPSVNHYAANYFANVAVSQTISPMGSAPGPIGPNPDHSTQ